MPATSLTAPPRSSASTSCATSSSGFSSVATPTARLSSKSTWGAAGHLESQMPVQRTHHYAIVDEADSILIDEARTPLIIGANNQPTQEEAAAYYGADPARRHAGAGQGLQVRPARAQGRAVGRRPAQGSGGRGQPVVRLADGRRALRIRGTMPSVPRSPISKTATTSPSTARSSSSTNSPAV